MMDFIQIMAAPFTACLVLVGIHVYLGIHILTRGVIFIDLALAQIAALGTAVGFLFGLELESQTGYLFALGFTFLGAAVFSVTRMRNDSIPQEAIIGIVYAVASSAVILALDRAPHGAEHIKSLLVGSILWVTWPIVIKTALLFAVIGLVHWFLRNHFLAITSDPDGSREKGYSLYFWDFLFYVLFGFVVTSAVRIAGVLLVFSFLIVPAVFGFLFARTLLARLLLGWAMGTGVSILGITFSYMLDLPTGATVVTTFGILLLLSAFFRMSWKRLKL
jgi:zinc/manganese transport system permease protein